MFIEVFNDKNERVAELKAGKAKGVNKVLWGIRRKMPNVPANPGLLGKVASGPFYPPGKYTVKITKKDTVFTSNIVIQDDPNSTHSPAERKLKIETVEDSYSLLENIAAINIKMIQVIALLDSVKKAGVNPATGTEIDLIKAKTTDFQNLLVADSKTMLAGKSKLREKAADIYSGVISYLGAPTKSQIESLKAIKAEFLRIKGEYNVFSSSSEEKLNKLLKDEGKNSVKF